ncbi:hypothetical protein Tco_1060843 [Tanacetum coccineum]
MMVQAHEEIGEGSEIPIDPHHTHIIQSSTSQPHKKQSRRKQRKDTEIPQSSGPTKHIADEVATKENVPTQSNDLPLSRVNTPGSGEDRLSLKELMDLCTKFSNRVLGLETTKTAQAKEIASLKKRVKKLERKRKSKTSGMKILFKIGRSAQVVSSEDEDYELAQRLQAEEQGELTIEERSKLFIELMDKRKKYFTKLRAEKIKRKPPTKAQKRNQIYSFVPMDTKVVKGSIIQAEVSKKRTREELESDNSKKQKIDENEEAEVDDEAEMKNLMEIVPDDEVAIDAIPLAT